MKRLKLRLGKNGTFILTGTKDADKWEKEFTALFQALDFAHALDPENDVQLTIVDSNGQKCIEAFV